MTSTPGDPTRTSAKEDKQQTGSSASPAPAAPLDQGRFAPGVMIADRYRIVSLLGKGGMGEVYRADDLKLRLPVALKLLPPGFAADPGRLARFHNEVRIARQVSHPNVCRVHDIGEVKGLHYLSMEYVDGEDLASLLRRIGRLPRERALEVARQICAGLAAAHDTGVLHRDLKPANVMIDGRGRARLTDFGLAVAQDDARTRGEVAGTPAYMAPEQIEGRELSARADLYALGLVLYEVFAGRPAFKADTVSEVLRLQRESTPTPPSRLVPDLEPAVERTILQCLEKDPARRPASAGAVAAALLGEHALEAAIAAGETPSPEMVAAAGAGAAWSPALALTVAVLAPLLFLFDVAFHDRAALFQQIPWDKPPAVLADRAREVLKRMGYGEEPGDHAMGFAHDQRFLQYVEEHDRSPRRWDVVRTGQPATVYFWYRESSGAFAPLDSAGIVNQDDPPLQPGMARVRLDTRGRLLELAARPAEGRARTDPAEADWTAALAEAGLDPGTLRRVEPVTPPPVFADARAAWEGVFPDQPRFPLRVEAGAYRGRLVDFRILAPWNEPRPSPPRTAALEAMTAGVTAVIVPVLGAGLILARRNHRLGRGDRRGAFRVAGFAFASHMLYWLFRTPHAASAMVEWEMLVQGVSHALFLAAELWVLYLALEPYVRRRWPETLLSWTRLLAGRFRDPLVGRDLLAGVLLTNAVFGCMILARVAVEWLGRPAPRLLELHLDLLLGPQRLVAKAFFCLALAVLVGMMLVLLLVLLRATLRSQAAAVAAFFALWLAIPLAAWGRGDTWLVELPAWAAFSALVTVLVVRFGLLACATAIFLGIQSLPVTLHLGAWYAQPALFAFGLELGLAGFGLFACLSGRAVSWGRLLDE